MSYTGTGSYFEFTPHEIFPSSAATSGYGEYYELPVAGYGEFYEIPVAGFGSVAATFSAAEVMANLAKSNACYGPGGLCVGDDASTPDCKAAQGACNWAGQKVNKDVAAALNELGYGPIAVDGTISWQGAYARFLTDHKLTKGPGFGLTSQALKTMEAQLKKGATPGPGKPSKFKKVNGDFIPVADDDKAGVALGLLAVAILGGTVAYIAAKNKRKKGRVKRYM